jgi:hypothetical protein
MKKLLLIGLVLIISTSCDKNDIEKSPIDGVWIEANHKTDTLVFDTQSTAFNLNRGTEVINGYLLPKYHSGLYMYELENDSISLKWLFSSSSYGRNYYLKLDLKNNQIKIGNFFVDSIGSNEILTFTKIH